MHARDAALTKPMTFLCLGFTVKKMKLLWKSLLVLLLAVAQQGYGCLPEGSNGKVTIGQKTYVCLVFNSESIVVVEAIADQFTRFVVADCKQMSSGDDHM